MTIFGSGHQVVTSTTRPASPIVGQIIYETNTGSYRFWTGAKWEGVTPVGTIQAFAGAANPPGWLLCNGATVNSVANVEYADLFTAIGVTYGGSGASSFNLPNLSGRIPVGAGTGAQQGAAGSGVITGGTALTARSIGQFFGDERTELHTHTQNSHNHTGTTGKAYTDSGPTNLVLENNAGGFVVEVVNQVGNTTPSQKHQHDFTTSTVTPTNQNTFAGTGANLQPSIVTNYIIKI